MNQILGKGKEKELCQGRETLSYTDNVAACLCEGVHFKKLKKKKV